MTDVKENEDSSYQQENIVQKTKEEKIYAFIISISIVVTILAGLCSITVACLKMSNISFLGIESWNTTISTGITIFAFFAGLWSTMNLLKINLITFADHTRSNLSNFASQIKTDVSTGEKIYQSLNVSGVLNKEVVKLLRPKEVSDFEYVFQRAKKVYAYNPPLRLLVRSSKHRKVIENILNNDAPYRIIAGPTCAEMLKKLKTVWLDEMKRKHQEDYIKRVLSQVEIIIYKFDSDLHSEIDGWLETYKDYRGLCFFLIQNGEGIISDNTVLLYILGQPFVSSFDVPSTAISINSTDENFELYKSMYFEYDDRWSRLLAIAERHPEVCEHTNLHKMEL